MRIIYRKKSAVYELYRKYDETKTIEEAKKSSGRPAGINNEKLEKIKERLTEKNDITLQELIDELDLGVCQSALSRTLRSKLESNYKKKTLYPKEQEREDVKKRDEWHENQSKMEIDRLIFLDECGVNTGMTRLIDWRGLHVNVVHIRHTYGRAFGGERVFEYVPDCRYETTTILSSVRLSGDTVPVVFGGALNGKTFKMYIEKVLAPTLKKGDIVVMDNLSSHKVTGVVEAIEKAGASVLCLPEYSPDLNPIESMWSKIKSVIRSLTPRTISELETAISFAFDSVSKDDISAWFTHCGYSVSQNTVSAA